MNRTFLIALGIVVILLGGALVAPSFIDWNKYKTQIAGQLAAATGYDYDIGSVSLSILPVPHVVVGGLQVRAPKVQGGATLLTLDRAEVRVDVLPLLSGQIHIGSVTLDTPVFTLATGKDGTPDWMTPRLQAQQKPAVADAPSQGQTAPAQDKIVLKTLHILNGSVRYEDQRTGTAYAASDIDLTLDGDSLSGPYKIDGALVYNATKIEIDGKTGAFAKGADSIAVSLKLAMPASKGEMSFSGVAGLKAPYEIQGETDFTADNLAGMLKPFTPFAAKLPETSVGAHGLLTFSSDAFALKNARFALGAAELNGDLALSGFKKPAMTVDVNLSADKPVILDALLPEAKAEAPSSGSSAPATKQAAALRFLPQSLSLPAALTGRMALAFKSITYRGQTFSDAGVALTFGAKAFDGQFKAALPGNGAASGTFSLAFASGAGAHGSGTVLSSLALSYRVQAQAADPAATLAAFLTVAQLKPLGPILSDKLALDVKGSVGSNVLKADAGALTMRGIPIAFSGSYAPKADAGRDAITLVASADRLDADTFLGNQAAPEADATAAPAAGVQAGQKAVLETPASSLADRLRAFSLPFDLDLGVTVKTLRYGGNDYGNVSLSGRMAGDSLTLKNTGFQDQTGNVLSVSGGVASVKTLTGVDITVNGKTPDASLLLKTLKVDAASIPANVGPASAVAEVKGDADKLGFTADLKALNGSMETSGTLAGALTKPELSDLTIRLRHPDYAELMRLYDPNFHASVDMNKTLDLFASMQRSGEIYTFKDIRATVGPSSMSGNIKADMGAAVPEVTASLQFTALPLDKLLGAEATADSSSSNGTERIEAVSTRQSAGGHWSRTPVNAVILRKWNADVKIAADSASYGSWHFTNAALEFQLKDGALTLSKLDGGLYGGHIDMTGIMSAGAAAAPLDASAAIKLDNVSLEDFAQSFSGSHLVKAQGTISLETTLAAKGSSPAELVGALGGKGMIKGSDIEFQGFDLSRISSALAQPSGSVGKNFSSLLQAATAGGTTKFDTLDGAFTVAQGVMTFDKLNLTGADASVGTEGSINLPLWTIDLTNTITLPEPKNNPPPPLKVAFKGPLDNPSQTFGKGALESYFLQQYGSKLMDKLDKKGLLSKVTGMPAPSVTSPAVGFSSGGTDSAAQPPAPEQKVKAKDLFKGVLQQMIQKQGQ